MSTNIYTFHAPKHSPPLHLPLYTHSLLYISDGAKEFDFTHTALKCVLERKFSLLCFSVIFSNFLRTVPLNKAKQIMNYLKEGNHISYEKKPRSNLSKGRGLNSLKRLG